MPETVVIANANIDSNGVVSSKEINIPENCAVLELATAYVKLDTDDYVFAEDDMWYIRYEDAMTYHDELDLGGPDEVVANEDGMVALPLTLFVSHGILDNVTVDAFIQELDIEPIDVYSKDDSALRYRLSNGVTGSISDNILSIFGIRNTSALPKLVNQSDLLVYLSTQIADMTNLISATHKKHHASTEFINLSLKNKANRIESIENNQSSISRDKALVEMINENTMSEDYDTTSYTASISRLTDGKCYRYKNPLQSLIIASVERGLKGSAVMFTAGNISSNVPATSINIGAWKLTGLDDAEWELIREKVSWNLPCVNLSDSGQNRVYRLATTGYIGYDATKTLFGFGNGDYPGYNTQQTANYTFECKCYPTVSAAATPYAPTGARGTNRWMITSTYSYVVNGVTKTTGPLVFAYANANDVENVQDVTWVVNDGEGSLTSVYDGTSFLDFSNINGGYSGFAVEGQKRDWYRYYIKLTDAEDKFLVSSGDATEYDVINYDVTENRVFDSSDESWIALDYCQGNSPVSEIDDIWESDENDLYRLTDGLEFLAIPYVPAFTGFIAQKCLPQGAGYWIMTQANILDSYRGLIDSSVGMSWNEWYYNEEYEARDIYPVFRDCFVEVVNNTTTGEPTISLPNTVHVAKIDDALSSSSPSLGKSYCISFWNNVMTAIEITLGSGSTL